MVGRLGGRMNPRLNGPRATKPACAGSDEDVASSNDFVALGMRRAENLARAAYDLFAWLS
jgi:hypothetical protein